MAETGSTQGQEITVSQTSVDDFVSTHQLGVEAIKIDVEGYDFQVLLGATKVIAKEQPVILTETPVNTEMLRFVAAFNYSLFAFTRNAHTRRKQFRQICFTLPSTEQSKMIFLVPPRLAENVHSRVVDG